MLAAVESIDELGKKVQYLKLSSGGGRVPIMEGGVNMRRSLELEEGERREQCR